MVRWPLYHDVISHPSIWEFPETRTFIISYSWDKKKHSSAHNISLDEDMANRGILPAFAGSKTKARWYMSKMEKDGKWFFEVYLHRDAIESKGMLKILLGTTDFKFIKWPQKIKDIDAYVFSVLLKEEMG